MRSVNLHRIVYQALLGRDLLEEEVREIATIYGDVDLDPIEIGDRVQRSDEFHERHREIAAAKLFPKSTVVIGFGPMGHELFLDLRQFHLGMAMAGGHFEPGETAFVRNTLRKGMHVLDVGANIGYFSTMFASLVGSSGSVKSFEPVSETHRRLVAAIRRNNLDHIVDVFDVAASDRTGTFQMSYDPDSLNMGGVSLVTQGLPGHAIVESISTVRLDDILEGHRVDFIKMDIEGAEGLALKGAENIIKKQRPVMMVEFNRDQLARVSQVTPEYLLNSIVELGYIAKNINGDGSLSEVGSVIEGSVVNFALFPN